MSNTSNNTDKIRTVVLYGAENAAKLFSQVVSGANTTIDICDDYVISSIPANYSLLRERASARTSFRYITEIRSKNIPHCKELMKVGQVRHLDGIKTNFVVTDTEYASSAIMQQVHAHPEIVYSNVKSIVEQQRYLFEHLWNKAVPAERKIREIEEGTISHESKIIENPDEIVKEIYRLTANSNELATCLPSGGMQYSYKYFFEIKRKLLDKQRRGEHKGIRYVTNIDKDNIQIAKLYLESGIQIRHVRNLPSMSFGVSDKEIAVTIEKMEGGKSIQSLLMSNDPPYVKHFTSIFEELWRNGIDASDRISEIEGGIEEANIEVIQNPSLARDLYLDTVSSAKHEILLIFPTTNAFIRHQRTGVIHLLREIVRERKVKIRILMPYYEMTGQTLEDLKKSADKDVDIRSIKQAENAMATFLVVDKKLSLVMEIKDDSKETFDESIGLSVYSTSKAGVLSYVSIFENLWSQTELYEQLKVHERMQREFINIASHEMRTPTQAVLGFSQLLEENPQKRDELIQGLKRNAERLQRLSNDILDVTRIESQTLKLTKEKVNINEIILNVISDVSNQIRNPDKLKISLSEPTIPIYVEADKLRLYQVMANLLSNAIKFTKEGTVSISLNVNNNNEELMIAVADEGTGIDPAIKPRLFTKFATRSDIGTGLGLYISKNIVEGHGGKMWAENNPDGRGATFSFALPINQ